MSPQPKFVLSTEEVLFNMKEDVKEFARVPISGIKHGAVGLASSGRVYLGVTVEFEDVSIYESIHAHQFLFTNLALNAEHSLVSYTVPLGFDRRSFEKDAFACLKPQNNNFALLNHDICSNPEHCSHLNCRALTAANKSYVNKIKCPAGAALICQGEVYRGWYIESFNVLPSLGPVQAALVDFIIRGQGKEFDKIVEVVLVEMKDAETSHASKARILLDKIAPGCVFNVLHCYDKPDEN